MRRLGEAGLRIGMRLLRRWSRLADTRPPQGTLRLRRLKDEALSLRDPAQRVVSRSGSRHARTDDATPSQQVPAGSDWHWRPAPWRGPLPELVGSAAPPARGAAAAHSLADGLTLFHDCPLAEICFAQVDALPGGAPRAIRVEVLGFEGSFLSLAADLPAAALQGLTRQHIVQVDVAVASERPLHLLARLNIRHGPNTAQLSLALPPDTQDGANPDRRRAEFDLAYLEIDEKRIAHAWVDLLFERPGMNAVILADMVMSRRRRAAL